MACGTLDNSFILPLGNFATPAKYLVMKTIEKFASWLLIWLVAINCTNPSVALGMESDDNVPQAGNSQEGPSPSGITPHTSSVATVAREPQAALRRSLDKKLRWARYTNKLIALGYANAVKQQLDSLLAEQISSDLLGALLHEAAERSPAIDRKEVIDLLLSYPQADVNASNQYGQNVLHIATRRGRTGMVQHLLGAPNLLVNAANYYGATALHIAASRGLVGIIRLLLGAPSIAVNTTTNEERQTALHWAAKSRQAQTVALLLEYPAIDVNARDKEGRTALGWAIIQKDHQTAALLLKHPAMAINIERTEDSIVLQEAADWQGRVEIAYRLLRRDEGHQTVDQLLSSKGLNERDLDLKALLLGSETNTHLLVNALLQQDEGE